MITVISDNPFACKGFPPIEWENLVSEWGFETEIENLKSILATLKKVESISTPISLSAS